MKRHYLLCFLLLGLSLNGFCQTREQLAAWRNDDPTGMHSYQSKRLVTITKRMDGYIVYNRDTIKGFIELFDKDVLLEQPLDKTYSRFYNIKLKNTSLRTIMMYNTDKKPFCLTRVRPGDKRMMRLVHEGKLNIYDDRTKFIYDPADIDKNLIVIAYDDVVDDLGSFLTGNTKRDLIGYVNDIYGMKIDPKTITWKELLVKVDMLD